MGFPSVRPARQPAGSPSSRGFLPPWNPTATPSSSQWPGVTWPPHWAVGKSGHTTRSLLLPANLATMSESPRPLVILLGQVSGADLE